MNYSFLAQRLLDFPAFTTDNRANVVVAEVPSRGGKRTI
jgi:hypothetical protein